MKKLLWAAIVILTAAGPAKADTLAGIDDARTLAQRAMERVVAGEVGELFDLLSPYWPMSQGELTVLRAQTVEQRKMIGQRFGATVGLVRADERLVADTVLRITYIEKFERHIVRWVFTFYNPGDGWIVNAILWDDEIDRLLD